MNKWATKEEITLPEAMAVIEQLRKLMAERAYLYPLDLASNIRNIQHVIPDAVSITIGKEAITFDHIHLGKTFASKPDELTEALEKCEWLRERVMR